MKVLFSEDEAVQSLTFLKRYYTDSVWIRHNHYDVSDKGGMFSYWNKDSFPNFMPKIHVWAENNQYALLVLLHELGHYYDWRRTSASTFEKSSTFRMEYFAYLCGWGVIKHHSLDTLITRDTWMRFNYHKLWRKELGMAPTNYKIQEKMPRSNPDLTSIYYPQKIAA